MKKVVFVLLILIAACTSTVQPTEMKAPGQMSHEGAVDVVIENFAFNEPVVKIKEGQTIRWTNKDSASHTATGTGFDTETLAKGESKETLFDKAGSYDYSCTFHPNMKGKVVVSQ
ncbi:cupredoxin family copper-binding protein [Candidatus Woesearchaeota archaeon]|nr:cupredoxin family copper-binding protein [Candidatus Woesearchaeota archaeon]